MKEQIIAKTCDRCGKPDNVRRFKFRIETCVDLCCLCQPHVLLHLLKKTTAEERTKMGIKENLDECHD